MCRDRVLCFLLTDPPATIPPPQSSQATVTVSSLRIAMALWHPIFGNIDDGNLEEVQRHVQADAAVLEERGRLWEMTPLLYAICKKQPAIALWLIEHRGQHDLDTGDTNGTAALQWASGRGLLSVVQALVGAGANLVAPEPEEWTPLAYAACNNHASTVDFLLQQPAVKATIDIIDSDDDGFSYTALSRASCDGYLSIVQLLLDAGADITIPAGQYSPLNEATHQGHHDVAALLRTALAEPQRPRSLLKARALLDATLAIREVAKSARDKGLSIKAQQWETMAAAPAYLKGRVAMERALPAVAVEEREPPSVAAHSAADAAVAQSSSNGLWRLMTRLLEPLVGVKRDREEEEELVACMKYALGLEGGGGVHVEGQGPPPQGMVHDVFIELCEMLVPTWDRDNV